VDHTGGQGREVPADPLTARQREPMGFTYDYHRARAGTIYSRWMLIRRMTGEPDAGLLLRLNDFDGVAFIRTNRRPEEIIRSLVHTGGSFYGSAGAGVALALDHCPFSLPPDLRQREAPLFGFPGHSLGDSQEIINMEHGMPADGLFTAAHISGVNFTKDGGVRWGTAVNGQTGHYFVARHAVFVFFSLDHVYTLARTHGREGKRARGLPEPWRISEHALSPDTRQALLAASARLTPDEAAAAMHRALGTTHGPFTHFQWGAA